MSTRARILSILTTALVSGCAPWPHFVTKVPEVEGRVTRGGTPVVGAAVLAAPGSSMAFCESSPGSQATDGQGAFRVDPVTELRFIYRPLVDPIAVNQWVLCIRQQGTNTLGYLGLSFQSREDRVVLSCDLDKQYAQIERGVQGVCQFVPTPKSPMQPTAASGG